MRELLDMSDATLSCPLVLDVERGDDVAVVRCHGKLVSGVSDLLYATVSPLIPETRRIVLDLTGLTNMDSMGIGTLIRLYVSARSAGCELVLINLGKKIRQLLAITNLLSVFAVVGEQNIKII
jgi:anti-sigma B factor antagonist